MPSHPFDAAAPEYDEIFTDHVPGRWFRDAVWSHLTEVFRTGDRVLDLGCGTGEDAVWFARRGIQVTAVDASQEMLDAAQRKAEDVGVSGKISFVQGDLSDLKLGEEVGGGPYEGALSNFGALNCVLDFRSLARRLEDHIRPGGLLILVVMGPVCPWEIAWYLLHGRIREAFRRFRGTTEAHVGKGKTIRIRYPSPRRLRSEFAPHFRQVKLAGLGTLVPPPYLSRLVEKGKGLFRLLASLEKRLSRIFPFTRFNDHYLIVLKRAGTRDDVQMDRIKDEDVEDKHVLLPSFSRTIRRFNPFLRHRIRELPILVLIPSNGCNCRCIMCDYWKNPGGDRELGVRELQHQMDSLKRLKVRWVLLSGGEPLLHSEIWGIARVLEPLGARISLLTNGLLLLENAEEIVRHCHEVIVSLDGGQEVHDRIRGVPGAYEKLSDGVKALRAVRKGFRVTARTVIQKANYTELPNIIDAARAIGLDRISFLAVDVSTRAFGRTQPQAGSAQHQAVLDAREAVELRRIIKETLRSNAMDFSDGFVAESPERLERLPRYYTALAEGSEYPPVACNAPWVSAVVEADGTVRPCFFHEPYGNIQDDFLDRILSAPQALEFRRRLKVKENPVCRRCVCPLYLR